MLPAHLQKRLLFDSSRKGFNCQLKSRWSNRAESSITGTSWLNKQLMRKQKLASNLHPSFGKCTSGAHEEIARLLTPNCRLHRLRTLEMTPLREPLPSRLSTWTRSRGPRTTRSPSRRRPEKRRKRSIARSRLKRTRLQPPRLMRQASAKIKACTLAITVVRRAISQETALNLGKTCQKTSSGLGAFRTNDWG